MVRFVRIFLAVFSGLAAVFFVQSGVPFLALISIAICLSFLLKTTFRFFKIALNIILGLSAIVIVLGASVLVYSFYTPTAGPKQAEQPLVQGKPTPIDELSIVNLPEPGRHKNPSAQPIPFSVHFRRWADSQRKSYKGALAVAEKHFAVSQAHRNGLASPNYNNNYAEYWQQIYRSLAIADLDRMPRVYAMFDSLRFQKRLPTPEFADMIVSCVQDIPYVLLHEYSCHEIDSIYPLYAQLHKESACMPNVRFGLQSPVEFMYNLKGDCDTRVILLYDIMSHFGFDVAILVSETYGHALLGVNLPARGNFVPYQGKKYYVWETTQHGYPLGEIDPTYEDMNYWSVSMTSK